MKWKRDPAHRANINTTERMMMDMKNSLVIAPKTSAKPTFAARTTLITMVGYERTADANWLAKLKRKKKKKILQRVTYAKIMYNILLLN